MATAHRLPSGTWRCQVYAGKDPAGRRQYLSFSARTKKDAEFQALQWQLHYKEVSRDASSMTLQEAIDRYIDSKSNILSPSTLRGYTIMAHSRLQGLMPIRLNRLTNALIQQAVNAEAREVSPKYLRNLCGLLRSVLKEYHPSFQLSVSLPQREIKEQKYLEPEQISALMNAVRGTEIEIPVLMGLWLGMRSSEITGLTWADVDFSRGTLFIHRAKVRDQNNQWVVKETTKNITSSRSLHIPEYLLDLLRFARGDAPPDSPVVKIPGNCLYQRLRVILKNHDLPMIRFHDLRHTFASSCAALGVPAAYTQKLGGWANQATMQRIYTHTMDSMQAEIDQKIDGFFCRLMEG